MTTTTYRAGARLTCELCGASTVVAIDGTVAWCTGRRVEHRRVAMKSEVHDNATTTKEA